MYVAYGWPRVLSVKADSVQEDVIHLSLNDDYLVAISTVSIQIWSGDQHRVMLGQLRRDAESITSDGLNRRAVWCGSRRLLAVLVSSIPRRAGRAHFADSSNKISMDTSRVQFECLQ